MLCIELLSLARIIVSTWFTSSDANKFKLDEYVSFVLRTNLRKC
jgi:hypothetical protein